MRFQQRSVEWWTSQHKLVHDIGGIRWGLDEWQRGRCVLNIAKSSGSALRGNHLIG